MTPHDDQNAPVRQNDLIDRNSGTGFFSLPPATAQALERELEVLLDKSRAKCSFVLDRTGVILAAAGDFHPLNSQVMGATAAGVIAALNTMVARANSAEVSVKFYGSDVDKIHFVLLSDRLTLCMLHSRLTASGPARAAARAFAARVTSILAADRGVPAEAEKLMQTVNFIENKLDEMFKDFL